MMTQNRSRLAAEIILAQTRAKHQRAGQGDNAALEVDDGCPGVIEAAMTPSEFRTKLCDPAFAPDPAGVYGKDDSADEEREEEEILEAPAFGKGPQGDG